MAEQEPDNDSQKTEEPTQKRLEETREKGRVAFSKEVSNWFALGAATLSIFYVAPWASSNLLTYLSQFVGKTEQLAINQDTLSQLGIETALQVSKWLGPLFGLIIIFSVAGSGIQTQFLISKEALKPKFDKISPLAGLKRLFSKTSLVEFIKGLLKISLVGSVFTVIIVPFLEHSEMALFMGNHQIAATIHTLTSKLFMTVLAILFIIAGLDYVYTRFEFMKKLKMSRHEIKEEQRQAEGDPHVRAKLRQLRAERGRRRMMAAVPKASVVITNPTHFAVALLYDENTMSAPVVVAKGVDLVALRIRETATSHQVPLVQNPPLAQTLYKEIEIDEEILPQHYHAVAEVIRYVMSLKEKPSMY